MMRVERDWTIRVLNDDTSVTTSMVWLVGVVGVVRRRVGASVGCV